MPARRTRIRCFLADILILFIPRLWGYGAGPARASSKSQEEERVRQSKSGEKFDGVRPRASLRGTDAATSSHTASHLDRKQNPVGPAPAPVNRREAKAKDFISAAASCLYFNPTHSRGEIYSHPCAIQSGCPFHLTTSILGRRRRCPIPGRSYRRPSPSSMAQRHELEASTPAQ